MGMDVRDYDLAILKRILYFFPNTHWINKPNLSIMEIRNKKIQDNEDIDFPIILIRRVSAPTLYKDTNSWAAGIQGDQRGRDVLVNKKGEKYNADITVVQANFELKYMVDVFSFERDNFDELFLELQDNLFKYPYVTFNNYKDLNNTVIDLQVPGMSTNIMVESCEDNTDFENLTSNTPFYRGTVTFSIRAYIYRKYGTLLIEDYSNGYKILDWKGIVRQVVDTMCPTPIPDPETQDITIDGISDLDGIGSVGLFQYSEIGDNKSYGSKVNGKYLHPLSINLSDSGEIIYSYDDNITLTGTWNLLSLAVTSSIGGFGVVLAIKVSENWSNMTTRSSNENKPELNKSKTENNDSITIGKISNLNGIGSVGMFQYSEIGDNKSYGSKVNGKYLHPLSINLSDSGEMSYSSYNEIKLTGTWKLLNSAKNRSDGNSSVVIAVKVNEDDFITTESLNKINIMNEAQLHSNNSNNNNCHFISIDEYNL